MDQNGAKSQEGGERGDEFSAILTPYRSLSARGFLVLMSVIGVISFIAGMAFLLTGAWPVFGFFSLDVIVIYYAFKLNYRAARAYERVSIGGGKLTITRVSASGRSNNWTFNPYWARVDLASRPGRRQPASYRIAWAAAGSWRFSFRKRTAGIRRGARTGPAPKPQSGRRLKIPTRARIGSRIAKPCAKA